MVILNISTWSAVCLSPPFPMHSPMDRERFRSEGFVNSWNFEEKTSLPTQIEWRLWNFNYVNFYSEVMRFLLKRMRDSYRYGVFEMMQTSWQISSRKLERNGQNFSFYLPLVQQQNEKKEDKMVDYILVTDKPHQFHQDNIRLNPSHYSLVRLTHVDLLLLNVYSFQAVGTQNSGANAAKLGCSCLLQHTCSSRETTHQGSFAEKCFLPYKVDETLLYFVFKQLTKFIVKLLSFVEFSTAWFRPMIWSAICWIGGGFM